MKALEDFMDLAWEIDLHQSNAIELCFMGRKSRRSIEFALAKLRPTAQESLQTFRFRNAGPSCNSCCSTSGMNKRSGVEIRPESPKRLLYDSEGE
ncbi:MAG: hypothetical protein ACXU85_01135 [Xanthobacteraceae bacterium]